MTKTERHVKMDEAENYVFDNQVSLEYGIYEEGEEHVSAILTIYPSPTGVLLIETNETNSINNGINKILKGSMKE